MGTSTMAQTANREILKGNEEYKKTQDEAAISSYQKALNTTPASDVANYNLVNSLYKSGKAAESQAAYDNAIQGSKSNGVIENGYYNKGVVYQQQKQCLRKCYQL